MMAAQELVCFNINHCMYLTCPVAKIKSTTVEGLQPGHGLRGFVQPPPLLSPILHWACRDTAALQARQWLSPIDGGGTVQTL